MRTLNHLELKQIKSCREQCTVKVERAFEWVTIKDIQNVDNSVFLQNSDASRFIADCDQMYKTADITFDDCVYFYAYEYLDQFSY